MRAHNEIPPEFCSGRAAMCPSDCRCVLCAHKINSSDFRAGIARTYSKMKLPFLRPWTLHDSTATPRVRLSKLSNLFRYRLYLFPVKDSRQRGCPSFLQNVQLESRSAWCLGRALRSDAGPLTSVCGIRTRFDEPEGMDHLAQEFALQNTSRRGANRSTLAARLLRPPVAFVRVLPKQMDIRPIESRSRRPCG